MLNNINVKILRGGYEMYKYKFVFFLTSLLFIFICTILVSAPAFAQGSFFDALCGAIANNINELVIGQEVDQETKQIQISAVKVLLRGNESDWDEFVDSTKDWAESSLKTESSKTTQSTTYRKEQQKFVNEVSRIKKVVGKTYYFEGKVGNINFTMEVPPYKCIASDRDVADREAEIDGIYPLNRTLSSENKIKSFFNSILGGTKKDKQYLVFLEVFDAKTKSYWPSDMGLFDCREAFGLFAAIIDEDTKYLDLFKDAVPLPEGIWNWDLPYINENVKFNIPDVFIHDLNHDGFDEITMLTYWQGSGVMRWSVFVYSTKISLEKILQLTVVEDTVGCKFYFSNINFDGDNLYIDGKNIMEYK